MPPVSRSLALRAGLMALPHDILDTIFDLVHANAPDQRLSLASTCRAFEAQAYLHYRTCDCLQTSDTPPTDWLSDLAGLPYVRSLRHVSWTDQAHAGALCAMLRCHIAALPLLADLQLEVRAPSAHTVVAVLAAGAQQLTSVQLVFPDTNRQGTIPAVVDLPHLPALRSLIMRLPLADGVPAAHLPLGLSSLSNLCQLTSLRVHVRENRRANASWYDNDYALAGMYPVAAALPALTQLRELSLYSWSCAGVPAAHTCWQALAAALPTLPYLHTLDILHMLLFPGFDASHVVTLASALARLSSLRTLKILKINGFYARTEIVSASAQAADRRAASVALARAVGTLTGLEALKLSKLRPFLRAADCHAHLSGLTSLTALELSDLACAVPPSKDMPSGEDMEDIAIEGGVADDGDGVADGGVGDSGDAVVSMLDGMTHLVHLKTISVPSSARAMYRFVSEAVPALVHLQTVVLPDGVEPAVCRVLASKLRDGQLPGLRTVLLTETAEQIADLNLVAERPVFALPPTGGV